MRNKGILIIIGGAEDKEGKCEILKKVVELSGNINSRLVLMTTATQYPKSVGENYKNIFSSLGVLNIEILNINSRIEASNEGYVKIIENASCIFFTGGDQLRITSLLGGTKIHKALIEAYSNGTLIVGTSAGASAMSSSMIVTGKDDDAPKYCTLKMAPGLGLLDEVIIDQHFAQRGRIGRLFIAVAQNPHMLGVGIDEDTAIIVKNDGFEVIGSQSVTVVDGINIINTNVSELLPNEPICLTNVTIHVLSKGYGYNFKKRQPIQNINQEDN